MTASSTRITRFGALALAGALFASAVPAITAAAQDHAQQQAQLGAEGDGDQATSQATAQSAPVALSALRGDVEVAWWQRLTSLFGLFAIVGIAWALSSDRRAVPWRVVGWGLGLQMLFGLFVLKTDAGFALFRVLNDVVVGLLGFTMEGSRFIFQSLEGKDPAWLSTVAFGVLPTIIFFSSLMAVLYHLGVMQRIVAAIAYVMRRTMRTSGSETLSVSANIFVGQTEAPLLVKPFVDTMTRSELNAVMVGGFATVAGGVLAAYVGMLQEHFPDIAGHLIAASVMSAPAAMVVAKVMVPEREESATAGALKVDIPRIDANVIDAAARGAGEGLQLALNVAAMLLAFLALVAMLNFLVGLPSEWVNALAGSEVVPVLSMQTLFGWVFWPLAFLMGVPPEDCAAIGTLLGEKMVLNEFVAYLHLAESLRDGAALSHRSVVIATYALCGFANFGSIAIQIGGIGGIAPARRADLARLGLRAMFGGMLAACMTATVAGMLV